MIDKPRYSHATKIAQRTLKEIKEVIQKYLLENNIHFSLTLAGKTLGLTGVSKALSESIRKLCEEVNKGE